MLIWNAHKNWVRKMVFLGDGRTLATIAGNSRFVWLWDFAERKLLRKLDCHPAKHGPAQYSMANFATDLCSAGGRLLASSDRLSQISLVESETGKVLGRLKGWSLPKISPDANWLAVCRSGTISLWKTCSPDFEAPPERSIPVRYPCTYAFTPDSRWLVVSTPSDLQLFYLTTENRFLRRRKQPGTPGPLAVSPDGQVLAAVLDGEIEIWNRDKWTPCKVLDLAGHGVRALAFAPDNKTLLTAGTDGTSRFWCTKTGAETARFDWGIGKIMAATFAPDGLTCAAGGEAGQILVWDVEL